MELLDFAEWFLKRMESLEGETPVYFCLDFLSKLPKDQRSSLLSKLKDTNFLNYFIHTLPTLTESGLVEFFGYVSVQAITPWLTVMTQEERGIFCSKLDDRTLQSVIKAVMVPRLWRNKKVPHGFRLKQK